MPKPKNKQKKYIVEDQTSQETKTSASNIKVGERKKTNNGRSLPKKSETTRAKRLNNKGSRGKFGEAQRDEQLYRQATTTGGRLISNMFDANIDNSLVGSAYSLIAGGMSGEGKKLSDLYGSYNPYNQERITGKGSGLGRFIGTAVDYGLQYKAFNPLFEKGAEAIMNGTRLGNAIKNSSMLGKIGQKAGAVLGGDGKAVVKTASDVGKDLLTATVGDATLGLAQNFAMDYGGEGLRGEDLARQMAFDEALDFGLGGLMEGLPYLKGYIKTNNMLDGSAIGKLLGKSKNKDEYIRALKGKMDEINRLASAKNVAPETSSNAFGALGQYAQEIRRVTGMDDIEFQKYQGKLPADWQPPKAKAEAEAPKAEAPQAEAPQTEAPQAEAPVEEGTQKLSRNRQKIDQFRKGIDARANANVSPKDAELEALRKEFDERMQAIERKYGGGENATTTTPEAPASQSTPAAPQTAEVKNGLPDDYDKGITNTTVKGAETAPAPAPEAQAKPQKGNKEKPPKREKGKATAHQTKVINDYFSENGNLNDTLKEYGVNSVEDLSYNQAYELYGKIKNANGAQLSKAPSAPVAEANVKASQPQANATVTQTAEPRPAQTAEPRSAQTAEPRATQATEATTAQAPTTSGSSSPATTKTKNSKPATEAQMKFVKTYLEDFEKTDAFLKAHGLNSLDELDFNTASKTIDRAKKYLAENPRFKDLKTDNIKALLNENGIKYKGSKGKQYYIDLAESAHLDPKDAPKGAVSPPKSTLGSGRAEAELPKAERPNWDAVKTEDIKALLEENNVDLMVPKWEQDNLTSVERIPAGRQQMIKLAENAGLTPKKIEPKANPELKPAKANAGKPLSSSEKAAITRNHKKMPISEGSPDIGQRLSFSVDRTDTSYVGSGGTTKESKLGTFIGYEGENYVVKWDDGTIRQINPEAFASNQKSGVLKQIPNKKVTVPEAEMKATAPTKKVDVQGEGTVVEGSTKTTEEPSEAKDAVRGNTSKDPDEEYFQYLLNEAEGNKNALARSKAIEKATDEFINRTIKDASNGKSMTKWQQIVETLNRNSAKKYTVSNTKRISQKQKRYIARFFGGDIADYFEKKVTKRQASAFIDEQAKWLEKNNHEVLAELENSHIKNWQRDILEDYIGENEDELARVLDKYSVKEVTGDYSNRKDLLGWKPHEIGDLTEANYYDYMKGITAAEEELLKKTSHLELRDIKVGNRVATQMSSGRVAVGKITSVRDIDGVRKAVIEFPPLKSGTANGISTVNVKDMPDLYSRIKGNAIKYTTQDGWMPSSQDFTKSLRTRADEMVEAGKTVDTRVEKALPKQKDVKAESAETVWRNSSKKRLEIVAKANGIPFNKNTKQAELVEKLAKKGVSLSSEMERLEKLIKVENGKATLDSRVKLDDLKSYAELNDIFVPKGASSKAQFEEALAGNFKKGETLINLDQLTDDFAYNSNVSTKQMLDAYADFRELAGSPIANDTYQKLLRYKKDALLEYVGERTAKIFGYESYDALEDAIEAADDAGKNFFDARKSTFADVNESMSSATLSRSHPVKKTSGEADVTVTSGEAGTPTSSVDIGETATNGGTYTYTNTEASKELPNKYNFNHRRDKLKNYGFKENGLPKGEKVKKANAPLTTNARYKDVVARFGESKAVKLMRDIEKELRRGGTKQTYETLLKSKDVSPEAKRAIMEWQQLTNAFQKEIKRDKDVFARAKQLIDTDAEKAYKGFNERIESGAQFTSDDVASAYYLIQKYGEEGQFSRVQEITEKLASAESVAGRTLHAMRNFHAATPEGRIASALRNVRQLEKRFSKRGIKIEIGEKGTDLLEAIFKAQDDDALYKANHDFAVYVWDQIPPSLSEKATAWRYLSMLYNPKTWIRNAIGNMAMIPTKGMADVINASIEKGVTKTNWYKSLEGADELKGTHAVINRFNKDDRALLDLGDKWFRKSRAQIDAEGSKWFSRERPLDSPTFKQPKIKGKPIKIGKYVFDPLNGAMKTNDFMLTGGDIFFMGGHYKNSFAQYLKANGIKASDVTDEIAQRAHKFAMQAAEEGTFRDANALADWLNNARKTLEPKAGDSDLVRAGKFGARIVMDATVPFVRTPMNILKRGLFEYNPIGAIRGVNKLIHAKTAQQAMDAIQLLGQGATGTTLAGLGMILYNMGVLSGSSDYDKQTTYAQMLGEQDYALSIGDKSYTVDWVVPDALPLFMGVELAKSIGNGQTLDEKSLGAALDSLKNMADPIFELSMLQGIENTFQMASKGEKGLGDIAFNAMGSYMSQFIPTVVGQASRTYMLNRKTAVSTSRNASQRKIDKIIGKLLNKTPLPMFIDDYVSQDYVDLWGRTDSKSTGVQGTRNLFTWEALENFFSPGYYSKDNTTPVDKELKALYERLDEESKGDIIPTVNSSAYIQKFDDKEYTMTPSEFTQYKKTVGQYKYAELEKLFQKTSYQNASDDEKRKMIKDVYDKAGKVGKMEYLSKVDSTFASAPEFYMLDERTREKYAQSTGVSKSDWAKAYNDLLSTSDERKTETGTTLTADEKRYILMDNGITSYKGAQSILGENTSKSAWEKASDTYSDLRKQYPSESSFRDALKQMSIEERELEEKRANMSPNERTYDTYFTSRAKERYDGKSVPQNVYDAYLKEAWYVDQHNPTDKKRNGSITQDEAYTAIVNLSKRYNLTQAQKAYLWALSQTEKGWKKKPFG